MIAPRLPLLAVAAAVVVPACAAAGLFAALLPAALLFLCAVFAIAAFDAWALVRSARSMQVSAPRDLKWFKDRPATLLLNFALFPERDVIRCMVALDFPPSFETGAPVSWVDAAGRASIRCTPRKRGLFEIQRCHIGLASRWKLWLIRSEREIGCSVRVYPDMQREKGVQLLLRRSAGLRTQRMVGRGREFERLREYAQGDSFDEISWKATARRSKPVVRVFQLERTQDVYVVLDSSRMGARNNAVEQFVRAALMVALATEGYGDRFGLVTFSNRVRRFIAPGHGRNHFSRCRDTIYDVQPERVAPDFEELFAFLLLKIRRRSLLLFLTDLRDPMLAESFLRDAKILARHHVVVVNRLQDETAQPLFSGNPPKSSEEISGKLASHLEWLVVQDVEKNLNRCGIRTHTLSSVGTGFDLIEQYAEVKRRQIL